MANTFSTRIYNRSWAPVLMPSGVTLTLTPTQWDANIVGGSYTAEIEATGGFEALLDLIHYLGYALWIMSPDEEYIWQGDIEAIELWKDGVQIGVTLENVVNRVQVLYTVFDPGGGFSSGETAWAQDDASILLYGRRERRHSAETPMRAAQAETLRDSLLARSAHPVATVGGASGGEGEYAILRCTGFWQRLARVYYAQDNGLVEYIEGGEKQPLGLGLTSTNIAASSRNGRYALHQLYGRFNEFAREGLQILVSGFVNSAGANNKAYTITGGDAKEPESITKSTVEFDGGDDIIELIDSSLYRFDSGDVIQISGSLVVGGLNNGTHLVKTPGLTRIEVSPGYHGAPGAPVDIQDEAAGNPITIMRGNAIEVDSIVVDEHTGASVTVTAYGQYFAQSFVTGTTEAWTAASGELLLQKIGAPTDAVYLRLCADDAGGTAPGSILDSGMVDDADIPSDEATWVSFEWTNTVTLNPGTTYWLVIVRTGANDSWDFYDVGVDAAGGYTGGDLLLHDGVAWQTPAEPMSLMFRVLGGVDTALQAQEIAEAMGVFSGVTVLAPSGIVTNQYRDGSQYAADEMAAFLDTGDSTNTRLLAIVGAQRNVTIRPVADPDTAMHVWGGADNLMTLQGSTETLGLLPVGGWVHLDDPALLQGALSGLSPFLVEYARYGKGNGWELRAAGQPDIWAVAEIQNG